MHATSSEVCDFHFSTCTKTTNTALAIHIGQYVLDYYGVVHLRLEVIRGRNQTGAEMAFRRSVFAILSNDDAEPTTTTTNPRIKKWINVNMSTASGVMIERNWKWIRWCTFADVHSIGVSFMPLVQRLSKLRFSLASRITNLKSFAKSVFNVYFVISTIHERMAAKSMASFMKKMLI